MARNILIKYDLDQEMIDGEFYSIDFIYDKCSLILSLELDQTYQESTLKSFDGQTILAQYRGLSRVDKKKLFVINTSQINRQTILDNLGI